MKKIIIIVAILLGNAIILKADEQNFSIGELITIKSKVLDEERNIIIYTPLSYNVAKQDYPVMYLLDGGYHFHHVSGIVQFMSAQGLMPEMLVVAITNVDRNRDFSPTHVDKIPTSGGAEKFMSFISDELIPYVDKNFRTQPYRILTGHSLGGEFAAHALLNKPEVFDAYLAISPYLMYDDNFVVKEAKTKLKPDYPNGVQFYMSIGDEPKYFDALAAFENIIVNKSPKGFEFTYVKMEGESHGSIPHLSIYHGLEWIYSEWKLPNEKYTEGLAAIDGHYKFISKKYGYTINTPENVINLLGYNFLGKNNYDEAIKVFRENVKRYPKSANVYDSLGEALEKSNEIKDAANNYKKAVKIANKTVNPYLLIYQGNLKRAQEKLHSKQITN
jgi:predicted alpha/beta superfamily hydrolase